MQCPTESKKKISETLESELARTGDVRSSLYFCTLSTISISLKKLHIDGLLMSLKEVILYFARRVFKRGQLRRQCLTVCTPVPQLHSRSSLGMRGIAKRPVSIFR